ncbi:hypothetical protein Tco_1229821 [Tanacetum coccineum]
MLDEEELLFLVGEQPNTFDADVDNQPVRDLARNEDNIFQEDECDAFDSDVDDEPTAQSIFMANLNNDQVEHEIHSEVQQSTVIDSNNANMGNSNVIPYEQYLTTNDVFVVPSCASSALNTAYVLSDNNVHTPNELLVTELAIYKEQVAIYEQCAKFKLTEREQRMDDQMHHDPTNVPSSKEDLELAELARQKMYEKMNDPVVQKSLVTEVRAMKAVFENMEAEVDQNAIDKKYREIERRNLLIMNENLIDECLSKDVFYTATDSMLNVSRFFDMHDALTIAQNRIADLESENFNLRNKIQNDDHDSMIKHFSKLEIQSRGNTIHELKEKISRLTEKNSDADPTLDLKALVSQNKDLTVKLNALHDLNERYRAENEKAQLKYNSKCVTIPDSKPKVLAPGRYPIDDAKVERPLDTSLASAFRYTKHSQELLEYVIGTYPKDFSPSNKQNASTTSLRKKRVTFVEPCETSTHNTTPQVEHQKINSTNAPGIPSTGVKGCLSS